MSIQIAMELNPKDATSIYMLGHYCYSIAEMPWLQKKIAEALFGKSPTSTFEEALHFFSKAEEAEPNFYRYFGNQFSFLNNLLIFILLQLKSAHAGKDLPQAEPSRTRQVLAQMREHLSCANGRGRNGLLMSRMQNSRLPLPRLQLTL